MSNHSKSILKDKRVWIVAIIAVLIITLLAVIISRNKLTPEETVSKFMYLVENKQYEEAKKMCKGKLEKLDILSTINPSNLTFDFSDDKKNASSVLLEDKETAEITAMYVELNNSIFGWKIKNYTVKTDYIPQSELQRRLENGENISESEFLLWAIYEETKVEDISKYAEDNLIILTLFANFMKNEQYERAMKLYKPINSELGNGRELSENEIKEFDWSNYNIYNSTGLFGMNTYMINNYGKKINVMVNVDHTISHIYEVNI